MSRNALLLTLLFLLTIALPYVLAAGWAGPQAVFAGFLFNPQDGHTYLAKMRQGWQGEWLFRLPFTADPGPGVFLFIFYLFLGHLARWIGLSLIVVFHLARLAASAALAYALYRFYRRSVPAAHTGWAFGMGLLCLGMGWMLLPAGIIPVDFWVAETYPFLSAFANPHFPLSLALMLGLLTLPAAEAANPRRSEIAALPASFALSLLSPFGLILAVMILGVYWLWDALPHMRAAGLAALRLETAAPAFRRIVFSLVGGGPFLIYYLWLTRTHPQLAIWNTQNLTLTPPLWDVAVGLSPALILAALTVLRRRTGGIAQARILIAWALIGLAFIYFPIGLQRRFMMGLHIPLVGLAATGLAGFEAANVRRARLLSAAAPALALPSTLLVILIAVIGARTTHGSQLYLTRGQAQAFAWIDANTAPDALVLASPVTGLMIPGATGRRVIYGHEYETVNAAEEQAAVLGFFSGAAPAAAEFLHARGVDYIFYGVHERDLGALPAGLPLEQVFSAEDVRIYRVTR